MKEIPLLMAFLGVRVEVALHFHLLEVSEVLEGECNPSLGKCSERK